MRQIQAKFVRISFLFVILGTAFSTGCFSVKDYLEEDGFTVYRSPIPAKIDKILVTKGQQVQKGDSLYILESMKMEFIIQSVARGKVKYIPYQGEDFLESGALLVSILPWQEPPLSSTPPNPPLNLADPASNNSNEPQRKIPPANSPILGGAIPLPILNPPYSCNRRFTVSFSGKLE